MNSKLRNSLSAFTASGAALAIALMVAMPAGTAPVQDVVSQDLSPKATASHQRVEVAPLAKAVVLSAEIAAASALAFEADRRMDAQPKQLAPRKGTRHRRQTIVMP
ncbi:MAG TPA: hypothetical protein VFR30_08230, partial [Lysobacter sp.]|nr:hypothetical protein [Lysobacter sp.]